MFADCTLLRSLCLAWAFLFFSLHATNIFRGRFFEFVNTNQVYPYLHSSRMPLDQEYFIMPLHACNSKAMKDLYIAARES